MKDYNEFLQFVISSKAIHTDDYISGMIASAALIYRKHHTIIEADILKAETR
jgi:hypothetical protein